MKTFTVTNTITKSV